MGYHNSPTDMLARFGHGMTITVLKSTHWKLGTLEVPVVLTEWMVRVKKGLGCLMRGERMNCGVVKKVKTEL